MVQAAFNPVQFDRASSGSRSLNLGLGGTEVIEHYLLLLSAAALRPERVYYGFFDFQLTAGPRPTLKDLAGNRSLGFFVFPDTARRYYSAANPELSRGMAVAGRIPMVASRTIVWGRVELVRRALGSIGMAQSGVNQFGKVDGYEAFERSYMYRFRYWAGLAVADDFQLKPAVQAMFGVARKGGATVCVVSMPMPSKHRSRFYESPEWRAYLAHVDSLVGRSGGDLIDASDWVPDSEFTDALHVDTAGAARFSRRLADERRRGGACGGASK